MRPNVQRLATRAGRLSQRADGADSFASPQQLRLRCAETKETDALRASLEAELAAVEEDVKRVEQELSAARSEARGQWALALARL